MKPEVLLSSRFFFLRSTKLKPERKVLFAFSLSLRRDMNEYTKSPTCTGVPFFLSLLFFFSLGLACFWNVDLLDSYTRVLGLLMLRERDLNAQLQRNHDRLLSSLASYLSPLLESTSSSIYLEPLMFALPASF